MAFTLLIANILPEFVNFLRSILPPVVLPYWIGRKAEVFVCYILKITNHGNTFRPN